MKKFIYLAIIVLALTTAVPLNGIAATPAAQVASSAAERLNINAATVKELQSLPGVGQVTAQRIIDYRNEHSAFSSAEQLLEVKGVGKKTLAKIKNLISVE